MLTTTKNISFYQLGIEHQKLFSQLYDYETGEVNSEIEAQISALTETTEKKCIAVTSWIKKLESDKRELEFLKDELAKRESAFNKEIDKSKKYLQDNMERCKITEVSCPYFTIRLRKNPYSTEILDESLIPKEYLKTKEIVKIETKPDKNAIKEEVLKTGIQIPGTYVGQKTKLEILTDKL